MARCELPPGSAGTCRRDELHGAMRPARHDPPAPARPVSLIARPDRLPSPSALCGLDPRLDRRDPPAPARGMSLIARPDRLPSPSGTRGLDPKVDRLGSHTLRPSRRLAGDGAATSCRDPGALQTAARQRFPGTPIARTRGHEDGGGGTGPCQLTSRQSLAPMSGVRWSMRFWESVRPRRRRRHAVPRSHGPAKETLNDQEVNFRLTFDVLRCARPDRGTRWPITTSLTTGLPSRMATVLGSRRQSMSALGKINTCNLAITVTAPGMRSPWPSSRRPSIVSAAAVVKLPNVKLL